MKVGKKVYFLAVKTKKVVEGELVEFAKGPTALVRLLDGRSVVVLKEKLLPKKPIAVPA